MKKLLNICLLLTSLIGYLEWGDGAHAFLFQVEYTLLFDSGSAQNFIHPFVLIPLAGQLLLLFTLFQKTPSRALTLIGLSALSILLLFIFFIGLFSLHIRMILSATPFIITGILVLKYYRINRTYKRI